MGNKKQMTSSSPYSDVWTLLPRSESIRPNKFSAERFITSAQLAKLAGVHQDTARNWAAHIRHKKIRTAYYFDNMSAKQYLYSIGKLIPGYNSGSYFEEWQCVPATRLKELEPDKKSMLLNDIDKILSTDGLTDDETLRRIVTLMNSVI